MTRPTQAAPFGPEDVAAYFTRADGRYVFARWGRPMAPVVFGVDDRTLATVKGAFEAVARLTGRTIAHVDPELGTNVVLFFLADWSDLLQTPDLDRLIPGLDALVGRLTEAGANQYRVFRFDARGAIRACFAFVRMDAHMRAVAAEPLALTQAVQIALLWSDTAFSADGPDGSRAMLVRTGAGHEILSPAVAGLLRVAYDPVLPDAAQDPAHALRLAARLGDRPH